MKLTKSDFLYYLQCPREFWLMKKKPELFPRERDEAADHLINTGYRVQKYAETLFPNAEFERRFETEHLLAKADIYADGAIYEVKSSGSVKEDHLYDLAFQKAVAEETGVAIEKTFLIHLNKEYIRSGEIEADKLLTIVDVTDQVNEKLAATKQAIADALAILETEPDTGIAGYCGSKLDCVFIRHHHPDLPEYTIFDISNFRGKGFDALFESGVLDINDVPADYKLTERQRKQVDIAQSGKPYVMTAEIKEILDGLEYPIYFMDYETANPGIPVYEGQHPFEVIPFQYSIHVQREAGGELTHHEFLAEGSSEPTRELIEAMKQVIAEDGGTVVVWSAYEKTRNNDMAARCVDHAAYLESVNDRAFDLMNLFSKGYYVDPRFKGSPSIKTVLPVMVPKMNYDGLAVRNGAMASAIWLGLLAEEKTQEQKDSIRAGLLEYCELDTQAMVEILHRLREECC